MFLRKSCFGTGILHVQTFQELNNMNRSTFIKSGFLSIGALMIAPETWAKAQPAGVFTELRPGAGYFTLRGGTIGWFRSNDMFVMIDSQFADTATVFADQFLKDSGQKIDLLINTHHHGDHTGGNKAVRDRVEKIVAQEKVPEFMKKAATQRNVPESELGFPDETFENEKKIKLGKEQLIMRHFGSAHSAGDTIVHLQKVNVAHMGDLMFNRFPPVIDRSSGASVKHWISVLEKAHKWFDKETKVIFGHGNPAFGVAGSKADLLVMRDFLSAGISYCEQAVKDGKTREQVVATEVLTGFEDFKREDRKEALGRSLGLIWDEVKGVPAG
jgi:glyoxylase-like metal-dependent hydrolase (beta-lactamase superfamily II)